jgi:hypothetical protein
MFVIYDRDTKCYLSKNGSFTETNKMSLEVALFFELKVGMKILNVLGGNRELVSY